MKDEREMDGGKGGRDEERLFIGGWMPLFILCMRACGRFCWTDARGGNDEELFLVVVDVI